MGANSKIEWTNHTFNPWIGCTKVAPGCAHCYAEAHAKRTGQAKWGPQGTRVKTSEAYWRQPFKWNEEARRAGERRRVFCASLADVFEEWDGQVTDSRGNLLWYHDLDEIGGSGDSLFRRHVVAENPGLIPDPHRDFHASTLDSLREDLFNLIDRTPWLNWLLLTKRPKNVRRMLLDATGYNGLRRLPLANVWIGTSISDQETADKALPAVAACRDLCPVRFLSAEPLLGPVDLHDAFLTVGIDWVICGGESGPGARPCDAAWIRSIVGQCKAADAACFVKQLGSHPIVGGDFALKTGPMEGIPLCDKKGGNPVEWPADLRVREFPREAAHA